MADFCTCDEFAMDDREDSFGFLQTDSPFPVPVDLGGTGADNAADARDNLGLGTAAGADIDATLSISGDAADAKATGDAIGALKSDTATLKYSNTTGIPANSDLNDYKTPGNYRVSTVNSRTLANAPEQSNARIFVLTRISDVTVNQIWLSEQSLYVRGYTSGTWQAWRNATQLTDATLTEPGVPADSKTTGDAIANLEASWPASKVSDYASVNFSGVIYNKIDDYNLRIYGTSTAAYLRYVNLFNGAGQLLTSSTVTPKVFPAGKYRFHYTFSGTYGTRLTVVKNTVASDTIPFEDGDVVDVPVPFGVGIRIPANSNWGTEDAPSYLYFKAEYLGAKDPSILFTTGNQTDRTDDIFSTLSAFGKCTLTKGEYFVSGFNLPPKSLLCGCGKDSVLRFSSNSVSFGISMKHSSTIENLKIVGPQGEGWVPDGVATARHGIVLNTEGDTILNRNRITIHNVAITGFDGAGIYMASTGTNVENGANISDCYVYANNYGLDNPTRSEYNRVCNCSFARNHVGVRNIGGNNLFTNCGINGNYIGLVMDATEVDDAYNNSHGTFSCCTINHSIDGNNTTTTAIQINGMVSGEVFSGCQIAYGAITIAASKGIHFDACNFLSQTSITVTGNDLTLFSNCIFLSAAASPITGGGNVVLSNCYYRDGTPRT